MNRVSNETRRIVFERANGLCEYCWSQQAFCPDSFAVEHINPGARGGSDDLDNLALSCQGCNNHKYIAIEGVDPVTGKTVVLFNPRIHNWFEHFRWNGDYSQIIGLSQIGRATVARLHLNRMGIVNLRQALRKAGYHPPSMGI